MKQRCIALSLLLALALVPLVLAQSSTGVISGTVKDSTGAVIPNVTVAITHLQTDRQVNTATNERGEYVSIPLSVGGYRVEATLSGFKRAVRSSITLEVQQNAQVDFILEVGEIAERVELVGEAPLLEASTSTLGKVVDNRRIRVLFPSDLAIAEGRIVKGQANAPGQFGLRFLW